MVRREEHVVAVKIGQRHVCGETLLGVDQYVLRLRLELHQLEHLSEWHALPVIIKAAPPRHTMEIAMRPNPCAAWTSTYFASGLSFTNLSTFRNGTPSQSLSKRLHRVTQWKSLCVLTRGSRLNSSQMSRTGCSTSPRMRKSHLAGSKRGTDPECSTG